MKITFMQSGTKSEAAAGTWQTYILNLYFLMVLLEILWNCLEDWRISSPRNSHYWSSACLWASNFMDLSVTVSMRSSTYDRWIQRNEAMFWKALSEPKGWLSFLRDEFRNWWTFCKSQSIILIQGIATELENIFTTQC